MEEKSKSKRLDVILALLFLIPVALVFQQSATSLREQGAASGDAMNNAAMFPKMLAILLGVLAVAQVVSALLRPATDEAIRLTVELRNSLFIVAILAGYLLVLPVLGYHITTPILCFIVLILLGLRPLVALFIGLAISFVVALFFETALHVILPVGVFGIALPF